MIRSAVLGPHSESLLDLRKIRTYKWVDLLTLAKLKHFNVEYKRIQPQTQKGMPLLNRTPITEDMKVRSVVLGPHSESPLEIPKNRT